MITKKDLFQKVLEELERERQTLLRAAEAAYEGATNSEVKQENKYDTRGLESSYLALGQSKRALEVTESIGRIRVLQRASADGRAHDKVVVASLVEVENEELSQSQYYFLLPNVGGMKIQVGSKSVQVISSQSPLARELLGKENADSFTFQSKDYRILSIA